MRPFSGLSLLLLFGLPGVVLSQQSPPMLSPEPPAYLEHVRSQADRLVIELERFQQDIVDELRGVKDRDFYRRVDPVLHTVEQFRAALKSDVPRHELYRHYRQMDAALQDLLKGLHAQAPAQRVFQRDDGRIRQADESLLTALSEGDDSEKQTAHVVRHQVEALAIAAGELYRTGTYALRVNQPARPTVEGDLMRLSESSERLQQELGKGYDRQRLSKFLRSVDEDWNRATQALGALPPEKNAFLFNRARRVEQLLHELRRRLGLGGEFKPLPQRPGQRQG